MGRRGRSRVAGVLSVLCMLGAVAVAATAPPHAVSLREAGKPRLAIGPGDVQEPPPTPERPPLTPEELPGPPEPFNQIRSRGPATRGAVINIAGRTVQLPPDAYIEENMAFVQCVEGLPCPEAPYYRLRRGESTVGVSLRSGARFAEKIAPGEEGAFDFLAE
jgi:hypothetical protein